MDNMIHKTMGTWSSFKKGDEVKFIGADDDQIKWGSNDDPRPLLRICETYTIKSVEVHSWHTKIELEGIVGRFNSVHFKKIKED